MRVIDIDDVIYAMRSQTQFVLRCEEVFHDKISAAAGAILSAQPRKPYVCLTGPSGSGKTTTAMRLKAYLENLGVKVCLLSMDNFFLPLAERPKDIPGKQAAAAVGQMGLIEAYERHFRNHGIGTAQVLLTHQNLTDREQYLNARMTIRELLRLGIVPVINENDTVATDEITSIGDNDTLAAIVTCCIHADLLVLLSDIDGLYTANPHTHPDAKLIPLVEDITPEVMALADGAGSALGTGGMSTKLRAARMVTSSGADMVIANGAHPELLYDIAEGRAAGTRFAAHRQEA